MKRQEIIDYARTFLDVPFRHQGRSKLGIDCGGVIVRIAEDKLGLQSVNKVRDYPRRPTPKLVMEKLSLIADRIPKEEVKPGDIVVMAFGNQATHMGILTERGTVVHSTVKVKKCIEERFSDNLENIIAAYFRFKGVE